MNIDDYNNKQKKMSLAAADVTDSVRRAMTRYELDNTEMASVLAQLTSKWAHYSFYEVQNLTEEKEAIRQEVLDGLNV